MSNTIAQAIARMQANKNAPRRVGVYAVAGGWTHSKCAGIVYADRAGAEADYRFCCDWEKCPIGED